MIFNTSKPKPLTGYLQKLNLTFYAPVILNTGHYFSAQYLSLILFK